jgi:ribosomal protein S18 acetylase RimI-like enzyme
LKKKIENPDYSPSTTTSVTVRAFEPTDSEFILSLAPRLTIGIPKWRDPEKMVTTAQGWLMESMAKHGRETLVFVAQDSAGERLGFAMVEPSKHFTGTPEAYMGELVVSEEAERRGVGRALVDACTEWARAQGYSILALNTGAGNVVARRFYSGLGFLEEDVRLVKLLS